jgi:hypothetical protein
MVRLFRYICCKWLSRHEFRLYPKVFEFRAFVPSVAPGCFRVKYCIFCGHKVITKYETYH